MKNFSLRNAPFVVAVATASLLFSGILTYLSLPGVEVRFVDARSMTDIVGRGDCEACKTTETNDCTGTDVTCQAPYGFIHNYWDMYYSGVSEAKSVSTGLSSGWDSCLTLNPVPCTDWYTYTDEDCTDIASEGHDTIVNGCGCAGECNDS